MDHYIFTCKALSRNRIKHKECYSSFNAMVQLNSWIPLRCISSNKRDKEGYISGYQRQRVLKEPSWSQSSGLKNPWMMIPSTVQTTNLQSPHRCATVGAIVSSKVTRLHCRLPLAALLPSTRGVQPWRPVAVLWYSISMYGLRQFESFTLSTTGRADSI